MLFDRTPVLVSMPVSHLSEPARRVYRRRRRDASYFPYWSFFAFGVAASPAVIN